MFVTLQGIPVCVLGHDCALVLLYAIDVSWGLTMLWQAMQWQLRLRKCRLMAFRVSSIMQKEEWSGIIHM